MGGEGRLCWVVFQDDRQIDAERQAELTPEGDVVQPYPGAVSINVVVAREGESDPNLGLAGAID